MWKHQHQKHHKNHIKYNKIIEYNSINEIINTNGDIWIEKIVSRSATNQIKISQQHPYDKKHNKHNKSSKK